MADVEVHGFVAEGYENVREACARNFRDHGEVGAAFSVHDGTRFLVDLWGGMASPDRGRAWGPDTLGLVYSVTKGVTSVLLARLAEIGELELDVPVASVWPEFSAHDKGGISIRMLLSHRAGLPLIEPGLDLEGLLADGVAAGRLATQAPLWEPGTDFGYHALTWGWLVDELVLRVTGERVGRQVQRFLAEPLGLDLHVGLPPGLEARVADLNLPVVAVPAVLGGPRGLDRVADRELRLELQHELQTAEAMSRLFFDVITANGLLPVMHPPTWNSTPVRSACLPAANAITDARSLAALYGAAVNPDVSGLISRSTLRDFVSQQSAGVDRVTGFQSRFGTGFMLPTVGNPMYSEASFGHEGVGGAQAFGDIDEQIGIGYVPNRLLEIAGGDPRVAGLVEAVRQARRSLAPHRG